MAVPKKRTSKSRKNIRKNTWKKKVIKQAIRALFIAKLAQMDTNIESPSSENINSTIPSINTAE
uniref:Large ribosomal subunit protein bL32c n=1 Tax=Aphanochaete confervicola TaxID=764104 RepID=A0A6H1XE76_9CHLO|nr:ribosomal protein L32 [Aphanochaete confervicola]QJA13894.1 ribosomal protein L32 [Aphanochaete confervicola]